MFNRHSSAWSSQYWSDEWSPTHLPNGRRPLLNTVTFDPVHLAWRRGEHWLDGRDLHVPKKNKREKEKPLLLTDESPLCLFNSEFKKVCMFTVVAFFWKTKQQQRQNKRGENTIWCLDPSSKKLEVKKKKKKKLLEKHFHSFLLFKKKKIRIKQLPNYQIF